jgi:hypothetical protein
LILNGLKALPGRIKNDGFCLMRTTCDLFKRREKIRRAERQLAIGSWQDEEKKSDGQKSLVIGQLSMVNGQSEEARKRRRGEGKKGRKTSAIKRNK